MTDPRIERVHRRIEAYAMHLLDDYDEHGPPDRSGKPVDLGRLSNRFAADQNDTQVHFAYGADDYRRRVIAKATFIDTLFSPERRPLMTCPHVPGLMGTDELLIGVPGLRYLACANCAGDPVDLERQLNRRPPACDICEQPVPLFHNVRSQVGNVFVILRFGDCCAELLLSAPPKSVTEYRS